MTQVVGNVQGADTRVEGAAKVLGDKAIPAIGRSRVLVAIEESSSKERFRPVLVRRGGGTLRIAKMRRLNSGHFLPTSGRNGR
jgi:hypothetical protein